ncbi:MAG TPA: hypothetical protein VE619_11630 [Nitrososphaeraceae archaeon]|nr:hypothetical protein [Nitrososphaeraceae archaeon]
MRLSKKSISSRSFVNKLLEVIKKLSDKLLSNVKACTKRVSFEEKFPSDKKEFSRNVCEKVTTLKEQFPKYCLRLFME